METQTDAHANDSGAQAMAVLKQHTSPLYVRYCAFFPISGSEQMAMELALSLVTLERQVAPYVDICVIIYTLSAHKESHLGFCANFKFSTRVIALDAEYIEEFSRWQQIATEIKNKTATDQLCIIRMLADFHILPADAHRLLIGCDIFFLDIPQEVLRFVWDQEKEAKVLYMMDVYSFAGVPYRLRHYKPPILEGLLGDFYCLAPGVQLKEKTIHGCLKMIDAWPTGPGRWDPEIIYPLTHGCEQQATAILLQTFGGQALPRQRYSHICQLASLAVLHTHRIDNIIKTFDARSLERAKELIDGSVQPATGTSAP
jgi:hypothetical protein